MDSESAKTQTEQQTQHQDSPQLEDKENDLAKQMENLNLSEKEKKIQELMNKFNNPGAIKRDADSSNEDAKSDDNIGARRLKENLEFDSSDSDTEKPTVDSKGQLTIDGKIFNAKQSPNIFFYSNAMKSKPYGTYIKVMHQQWRGNYDRLEDDHSYIQWLFPNFYQSAFNSAADPLTHEEAECFKTNLPLAKTLVESYELILDFFGIRITNHTTGDLERTEGFEPRYKDAFLKYYHNHLRMRRILTHLNNVGFRRYAIKLVDFLEKEIYGEVGGYQKFEDDSKNFNKKAFEAAPLRKIANVSGAFPIWRLYGDHKNDEKRIALLAKNCFSKYPEDFADSVYFQNLP